MNVNCGSGERLTNFLHSTWESPHCWIPLLGCFHQDVCRLFLSFCLFYPDQYLARTRVSCVVAHLGIAVLRARVCVRTIARSISRRMSNRRARGIIQAFCSRIDSAVGIRTETRLIVANDETISVQESFP